MQHCKVESFGHPFVFGHSQTPEETLSMCQQGEPGSSALLLGQLQCYTPVVKYVKASMAFSLLQVVKGQSESMT